MYVCVCVHVCMCMFLCVLTSPMYPFWFRAPSSLLEVISILNLVFIILMHFFILHLQIFSSNTQP